MWNIRRRKDIKKMLDTAILPEVKTELLTKLYNNFIENGLDQTSMRDLCKGTGVSLGSLYYWFDDKEDLVIQVALWGLGNIIRDFFDSDLEAFCDIISFFHGCSKKFEELKKPLRFIYQVALSPAYGPRFQKDSDELVDELDGLVNRIIRKFSLDYASFMPIVLCFLSAIIRDVVWDDKKALDVQFEFLIKSIENL